VGAVSRNTVAAATELAYEARCRIMLIASRRQVDCAELGGGYVEGWSAETLAEFVRARDPDGRVVLARDHGGPWQHPSEAAADEDTAVSSAVESFRHDLRAGFELLHVDTTATPHGECADDAAMERLVRTYARVAEDAGGCGREVGFEVSLGPEGAEVTRAQPFRDRLQALIAELGTRGLPIPLFVVTATGTKVRGMENVGALSDARRRGRTAGRLRGLVGACTAAGVRLKAHNCDYLDAAAWAELRASGVDAANVAPEYGLAETRALVELLRSTGLAGIADDFVTAAYDSGAWRKWVSGGPALSPPQLGLLAGHYLFSSSEGRAVRALAAERLSGGAAELDARLRRRLKEIIRAHLREMARRPGLPVR